MWGSKPEWRPLKSLKMWGVTVPPKSPPMKPEEGRLAVTQVTANQNGKPVLIVSETSQIQSTGNRSLRRDSNCQR